MEHEHNHEAIRQRLAAGPNHSYLRDWVYGGIDGTVTTFAIVSGVVGARLSPGIILILGGASLIADGIAMAAGNYLATRAEDDEFHQAEAVERAISSPFRMVNGMRYARSCEDSVLLATCSSESSWRSPRIAIAGCG